jgi:hypothetical protein
MGFAVEGLAGERGDGEGSGTDIVMMMILFG